MAMEPGVAAPEAAEVVSVQVVGFAGTILEAIDAGTLPRPALMSYMAWRTWRAGEGLCPRARRDGSSTTNSQEATWWKEVMVHLYGADWRDQLAQRGQARRKKKELM